jgi:hypothetical protein
MVCDQSDSDSSFSVEDDMSHGTGYRPYCRDCDRTFIGYSQLKAHLGSNIHAPRDFPCISGCGSSFVSASAMVLHLEANTCTTPGANHKLGCLMASFDEGRTGLFVHTLVHVEPRYKFAWRLRTCYLETQSRRPLCPICLRSFAKEQHLLQHLASIRHTGRKAEAYSCPQDCKTSNKLSAIMQHVESGKCGANQDVSVKRFMDKFKFGFSWVDPADR